MRACECRCLCACACALTKPKPVLSLVSSSRITLALVMLPNVANSVRTSVLMLVLVLLLLLLLCFAYACVLCMCVSACVGRVGKLYRCNWPACACVGVLVCRCALNACIVFLKNPSSLQRAYSACQYGDSSGVSTSRCVYKGVGVCRVFAGSENPLRYVRIGKNTHTRYTQVLFWRYDRMAIKNSFRSIEP